MFQTMKFQKKIRDELTAQKYYLGILKLFYIKQTFRNLSIFFYEKFMKIHSSF